MQLPQWWNKDQQEAWWRARIELTRRWLEQAESAIQRLQRKDD